MPNLPGIVDAREMYRGRSRTASLDGVPQYSQVWLVRTSILNPNMVFVAAAPGIAWRAAYPDDANARLVDSSTQQDGESPFHYKVTFTYRYLDENDLIPWSRPSQWTFNGSLTSSPCFWHYQNNADNAAKRIIVNSAGDPLAGLSRDEGEFTATVTYNQKPPFNYERAQAYTGAINSDYWSGGEPKTWKVQSISASRKFESIQNPATPGEPPVKVIYWETSIAFAYKATTWDLMTWDVGFNEIVGGQRRKIMAGSEPVSEPAALAEGRAKAPGLPPEMLYFRIYPMLSFNIFEDIPDSTSSQYLGWPYRV